MSKQTKTDGKTSQKEKINRNQALFYGLLDDLRMLVDGEVNEDEFISFLDRECYQIEDVLVEAWDNWKQENEGGDN